LKTDIFGDKFAQNNLKNSQHQQDHGGANRIDDHLYVGRKLGNLGFKKG
jgi:hypothetical protein